MWQQNSHIDSWRFLTKMANLGKWGIEQESTHELVKTSNEVTKRGNIHKRQISTNMVSVPKIHQGIGHYGQIFKWNDKKGYVDSWRFLRQDKFCDDGEFGKKLSKVWQKFTKRWQKGASWQMAIITKMANWATFHLRFAKIQMRWQTRHVDNCEFYENDKCCKIREFGKDSSKVWENCRLIISENIKFGENGQSGKNLSKVWQKWKQDDKRRMSLTASFYEDVNFCEINKFLEKSIKGLAKFKWDDKNGHLVQIVIVRKSQI